MPMTKGAVTNALHKLTWGNFSICHDNNYDRGQYMATKDGIVFFARGINFGGRMAIEIKHANEVVAFVMPNIHRPIVDNPTDNFIVRNFSLYLNRNELVVSRKRVDV